MLLWFWKTKNLFCFGSWNMRWICHKKEGWGWNYASLLSCDNKVCVHLDTCCQRRWKAKRWKETPQRRKLHGRLCRSVSEKSLITWRWGRRRRRRPDRPADLSGRPRTGRNLRLEELESFQHSAFGGKTFSFQLHLQLDLVILLNQVKTRPEKERVSSSSGRLPYCYLTLLFFMVVGFFLRFYIISAIKHDLCDKVISG